MSGCPFTHPLDLDAYRDGMPYAALAEARAQGSFVRYEDPDTGVPYWAAVKRDALDLSRRILHFSHRKSRGLSPWSRRMRRLAK